MSLTRIVRTIGALGVCVLLGFAPDGPPGRSSGSSPLGSSSSAVTRPTDAPWVPPLGHPLLVVEPYDLPHGPYRAGHRGIDIVAASGAKIHAPASGTVSFVGTVVDRSVLSIRVDDRTIVSIEPVSSALAEGATVVGGQFVGSVATGGHCTLRCLHLGVRVDGEYVNPMRFLRQKPVLLPW